MQAGRGRESPRSRPACRDSSDTPARRSMAARSLAAFTASSVVRRSSETALLADVKGAEMSTRFRTAKTPFIAGFMLLLMVDRGGGQTLTRANPASAASPATAWTLPRTLDGQPDLQGVWDL